MESKFKNIFSVPDYQSRLMKEHIKDPKYKTELCKNYVKYGKCSYKGKCRYAHGDSELISKNLCNKNYKKTNCDKFYTSPGVCPYGFRCQYIHELRTLEKIEFLKDNYYKTLLWIKRYSDYMNYSRLNIEVNNKETDYDFLGENSEKQTNPYNLKSYFKIGAKPLSKVKKTSESIYDIYSASDTLQNSIYPSRLKVFADLCNQFAESIEVHDKISKKVMNYSTESVSTNSSYSTYLNFILSQATNGNFNDGKLLEVNSYNLIKNHEFLSNNKDYEESLSNYVSRKHSIFKRSCDTSLNENTKDSIGKFEGLRSAFYDIFD